MLTNGSVTWNWCNYQTNGGESCGGGAVHVDRFAHLSMDDCEIHNSSARYGGAIYSYGGTIDITNSKFYNNYAYEAGGAIMTYEHSDLTVSASTFANNAAIKAGAVFAGGDASVSTTSFVGNRATASVPSDDDHAGGFWGGEGGAYWVHEGTTAFSGCAFTSNYARTDGAAIHVHPGTGGVTVAATTFDGNDAVEAGDDVHYESSSSMPTLDCASSCPEAAGTCAAVECSGPQGDCDCYSCACDYPAFPTPQPTGPSAAPTAEPSRAPTTVAPSPWADLWLDDDGAGGDSMDSTSATASIKGTAGLAVAALLLLPW